MIREQGHELVFTAFGEDRLAVRPSEFAVVSIQDAARQSWDAVMLPGAGFPAKMIERLDLFHHERFGVRVQHILNDQSRMGPFLHANRTFRPHVVISNNRHWSLADLSVFEAGARYVLEGAVDVEGLGTLPCHSFPKQRTLIVGGLANKNPAPLLELVRQMEDVKLMLFGPPGSLPAHLEDLLERQTVEFVGVLDEQSLRRFYASVDLVIHTERNAGWANLAAEALAAGLPLICTRHGTLAFAENEETALVVDEPTPTALIDAVERLRSVPGLAVRLSTTGRERIRSYSWANYAGHLLKLTLAASCHADNHNLMRSVC